MKRAVYIISGILTLRGVSPTARALVRGSLAVSCVILAAALLYGVYIGDFSPRDILRHRLLADLYRAPQGVLLVSSLGALIVDSSSRGG